jgi:hypothetical protein
MNIEARAALRLDIAVKIFAAAARTDGCTIRDALVFADEMIRANDEFRAPAEAIGALDDAAHRSTDQRLRILDGVRDLGYELECNPIQVPRVMQAFRALRDACGISAEEIQQHIPF